MSWKISNFCESTLSQACEAADTTIYIDATDADLLPALGIGDKAKGVLFNSTHREIINITAESAGALTVERGQESTSARAWASGTKFVHTPTAEVLQATLASITATKFTGSATGTNAYTVDVGAGNTLPTLADGEEVVFTIPNSNTDAAAPTLVVTNGTTSTTSKNIRRADGSVPDALELKSGFIARAVFSTAQNAWLITNITSRDALIERINLGPIPAINQARNGMLDYWNNGTSFLTPASATETADGWVISYDGTIGTFTVSQQAFTLGQTDVEGDPKFFWRWAHASAGSGSTIRSVHNDVARVHWRGGETITISLWAKADTNRNVTLRTRQYFGTGGSPSADVDQTDVLALTTSWQKFTVTKTLGSLSGKTLGSNANDAVRIRLEFPLNVTMTIDVAAFDVRSGEVAGQASDTFPLSFQRGGLSGSYDSLQEISNALLVLQTDLALIEALTTSGLVYRNNTGPAWGVRSVEVGTGLSVANGDGLAGNPTVSLGTNLLNYNADPLSVAELASITGVFGTAAYATIGTSGDTVPKNNTANNFSASQIFGASVAQDNIVAEYVNATTSHRMAALFTNSGADWRLRPRPSGTSDLAKEFGYDFTNGVWYFDPGLNVGGLLSVAAGAAGAATASIFCGSDTNTYINFGGSDTIAFGTGGSTRLTLTTTDFDVNTPVLSLPTGSVSSPGIRFRGNVGGGYYLIGTHNWGFALNGVKYVDYAVAATTFVHDVVLPAIAPTSVYSAGYRGSPVISGNSAYAFPAAEAGCTIYHDEAGTRTYTIPANASVAHPIGTTFVIDNTGNSGAAGAITLAITTDTLRRGDGTSGTGSRTIPASGVAVIRKVAATIWVITGTFT